MRIVTRLVFIVSTWLTVACAGSAPAIKAALHLRVAQIPPGHATYPSPTIATIRPLKTGQWIQTKRVDPNGAISLMTIKIVGQEGPALWTEIVREPYDERSVIKSLVDYGDSFDPTTAKILAMTVKDKHGLVKEYHGPMPAFQWQAPTLDTRRWDVVQTYRGTYDVGVSVNQKFWHGLVASGGSD